MNDPFYLNFDYRSNMLKRSFYEAYPTDVAKKILGKYLVRDNDTYLLVGKIVEVEAYLPFDDPAAHNYNGKTPKTKSLFQQAGYTYVHSMRKYNLLDIVTEGEDRPGSILIRAIEPLIGVEIMIQNRVAKDAIGLTNGPGKICQALNITRSLDGIDTTVTTSKIFVAGIDYQLPEDQIISSPRIGISKAKDELLRFTIKDNPYLSHPVRKQG